MSHQSVPARLNEKKASGPSPSLPVQPSSGICIKHEYFEDQLLMTRTIKTQSESAPNEHNIMQSIKVEVKEEHYHDQDCVVKCDLDFDEGEQIRRKIKVKVEDISNGQTVQHFKCVKKEEDDGGECLLECDCKECETCRVKMEMKEELDESGFETELGGNSGETGQGFTRVKKEEVEDDGDVERPNKIRRMDRVVMNVPIGSPSPSPTVYAPNVVSINVEGLNDSMATSSTNSLTIEDQTRPSQSVNEDGGQSFEQRQDTSAAGGQQVLAENFVKQIEPADELGNRFECNYQQCGRRMKHKSNLIRHIRSHTGEKLFKCSVNGCDRAFVQKGDLESHLNTHSGDRPFVCTWPGCDARFAQKISLTAHLRTHTGERPFECDQCDATFTHHGNLVTHLRTHTGARPFVCTWPECGQAFTQSSNLKTHSFVHSNERQFACNMRGCTKVYKHKVDLRKHQEAKHI